MLLRAIQRWIGSAYVMERDELENKEKCETFEYGGICTQRNKEMR
jgi:hypothetical protein